VKILETVVQNYKLCLKGLWKKKFRFQIWWGQGTREKGFFAYYRREGSVKIPETILQIHTN
jgi:hypothetical protein